MSAKRTKTNEPSAASLREMPEVTDWSGARRNPYTRGRLARVLDADLAKAFPDSAAVNARCASSWPFVPSCGQSGDPRHRRSIP